MYGAASFPFWLNSTPVFDPYEQIELQLSIIQCAQYCLRRQYCLAMMHNADKKCRLVVGEGPPSPSSMLLRCCTQVPLTNVALNKVGRPSSALTPPGAANDGIFTNSSNLFHSDSTEQFPFLVLDLGATYTIEALAFMPRLDTLDDRFRDIEIRAELTDVAGPDFSSYTLLAHFPGPAPDPVTWVEKSLMPHVEGRFVSVQRAAPDGTSWWCLHPQNLSCSAVAGVQAGGLSVTTLARSLFGGLQFYQPTTPRMYLGPHTEFDYSLLPKHWIIMDNNIKAKRVSFADTKSIREFLSSGGDVSQWHSSYAATVSSSSSDSSGAVTTFESSSESSLSIKTQVKPSDVLQDHTADATTEDEEHTSGESNFLFCFLQGSQAGKTQSSSCNDQELVESCEQQGANSVSTCPDLQKQNIHAVDIQSAEPSGQIQNNRRPESNTVIFDDDEECQMELTCSVPPNAASMPASSHEGEPNSTETDELEFTCLSLPVRSNVHSGNLKNDLGCPTNENYSSISDVPLRTDKNCEIGMNSRFLRDIAGENLLPTCVSPVPSTRPEVVPEIETTTLNESNMEITCAVPSIFPPPKSEAHAECDMEFTNVVRPHSVTRGECDMEFTNVVRPQSVTRGECDMEFTNVVRPHSVTRGECDMEFTNVVRPHSVTRGECDMEFTGVVRPEYVAPEEHNENGIQGYPKKTARLSGSPVESTRVFNTDMELTNVVPIVGKQGTMNTYCKEVNSVNSAMPLLTDTNSENSPELNVHAVTDVSERVQDIYSAPVTSNCCVSAPNKCQQDVISIPHNTRDFFTTGEMPDMAAVTTTDDSSKAAHASQNMIKFVANAYHGDGNEEKDTDSNSSQDFISNVSQSLISSDDSLQSPVPIKAQSAILSEKDYIPPVPVFSNLASNGVLKETCSVMSDLVPQKTDMARQVASKSNSHSNNSLCMNSVAAFSTKSSEILNADTGATVCTTSAEQTQINLNVSTVGLENNSTEQNSKIRYNNVERNGSIHSDGCVLTRGQVEENSTKLSFTTESHQSLKRDQKNSAVTSHSSSTVSTNVVVFGKSAESPEPFICSDCHEERTIFGDRENAMTLQCIGDDALLRCRVPQLQVFLSMQSCPDGHRVINDAHWLPNACDVRHPFARLALSVFRDSMEQSSHALCKRRVCSLGETLLPIRRVIASTTGLLLELHRISTRFALKPQKNARLTVQVLGKDSLVELHFTFKARRDDSAASYGLFSSARSVIGCVRASKLEEVMREVQAGPLLLTRSVDTAAALLD
ncbi:Galactose-binding domain-like [Trinorchestia longiramus]|nr:Galactose-binding domain-like [Trinorchestia longiramus]